MFVSLFLLGPLLFYVLALQLMFYVITLFRVLTLMFSIIALYSNSVVNALLLFCCSCPVTLFCSPVVSICSASGCMCFRSVFCSAADRHLIFSYGLCSCYVADVLCVCSALDVHVL